MTDLNKDRNELIEILIGGYSNELIADMKKVCIMMGNHDPEDKRGGICFMDQEELDSVESDEELKDE
jgi:hypothetical protein